MKQDKIPTQQIISTTPFPNSKKIYVKGKLNDIEVAMREITLSDTKLIGGKTEKNPPVTVYDTSGVYTDENYQVDVKKRHSSFARKMDSGTRRHRTLI